MIYLSYALSARYDLNALRQAALTLPAPVKAVAMPPDLEGSVVHLRVDESGKENGDVFVFEDGTMVLWDVAPGVEEKLASAMLPFEEHHQNDLKILHEAEEILFLLRENEKCGIQSNMIVLNMDSSTPVLDKFAFSDGIARSVKLGMCEETINDFAVRMEDVIEVR